ncbi:MAG: glycosyltransferase family 2 protein [Cyanobacteria bacterium J06588_4]
MSEILLSIIIPTHNRPKLLPRAVKSALSQTVESFEVIVVDDCSTQQIDLPEHSRLKIIQLKKNSGVSAARNIGAKAARGRWITFLDDDDELLPNMAQISLEALKNSLTLPVPIAVVSGIEVINRERKIIQTRIPPTLPRGSHFGLEEIKPSQSFLSKQTLVVEKEVFLSIGGFDESFASRETTELFLRLNTVCSILGISQLTYRLIKHEGFHLSKDARRQISLIRLVVKHRDTFQTHPIKFADLVYNEVGMSLKSGQTKTALDNFIWAMKVAPIHTVVRVLFSAKNLVKNIVT